MKLEFWVTICLGHGDGGDVAVEVDVSDKEYELLKQCCRDDDGEPPRSGTPRSPDSWSPLW